MSRYIRPKVSGAHVFFTVNLADCGRDLLVREVELLRDAVRRTRAERPFGIEAWVVLPDHLHCIWQMPAGDRDYGRRWGAIKARFTMAVREKYAPDDGCRPGLSPAYPMVPSELPVVRSGRFSGLKPGLRVAKREAAVWQRRFWGEARSARSAANRPGDGLRGERAEPRRRSRSYSGRGGFRGASALLLDEPGEAWVGRAG